MGTLPLSADRIAELLIDGTIVATEGVPNVVLEELVKEEQSLAEIATDIASRCKRIRALLIENLPLGSHDLAGRKVIITIPKPLDKAAFAAAYPASHFPELYSQVLNTSAINHKVAKAVKEEYCVPGERQIQIRD